MSRISFHITYGDCSIVTTYEGWLKSQNLEFDEEAEYPKEAEYITRILSLDFTHWMMRLTSGGVIDGGNIDCIRGMRRRAIIEYENFIGAPYFDINKDRIWGD